MKRMNKKTESTKHCNCKLITREPMEELCLRYMSSLLGYKIYYAKPVNFKPSEYKRTTRIMVFGKSNHYVGHFDDFKQLYTEIKKGWHRAGGIDPFNAIPYSCKEEIEIELDLAGASKRSGHYVWTKDQEYFNGDIEEYWTYVLD